jgi:hypothetical protein
MRRAYERDLRASRAGARRTLSGGCRPSRRRSRRSWPPRPTASSARSRIGRRAAAIAPAHRAQGPPEPVRLGRRRRGHVGGPPRAGTRPLRKSRATRARPPVVAARADRHLDVRRPPRPRAAAARVRRRNAPLRARRLGRRGRRLSRTRPIMPSRCELLAPGGSASRWLSRHNDGPGILGRGSVFGRRHPRRDAGAASRASFSA